MRHLDKLVLKNGLLAGILCAVLIFGLGWTGWVMNPLRQGRIRAEKNVDYAVAMLNVEFERAEHTAHGLRALWAENTVDMKDPSRIAALQPFLDHSGQIMNIVLYKNDGRTLFIRQLPEEWKMVLLEPGATHPTVLRARGGKWVVENATPFERAFQPRARPWFLLAETLTSPAWTNAYTFSAKRSGFSFVVPVRDGAHLEGVVAVDVTLDLLERRLRELLPPSDYKVLVTDSGNRILISPDPPQGDAVAQESRRMLPASLAMLRAFHEPGAFRYYRQMPIRALEPSLELRVYASPNQLLPGLRLRIFIVSLAALLTFAAIMGYVLYLNHNLVRPIRRLLGQENPESVPSEIWEFRQLEESIQRLGQTESDRQQILQQLEHAQRVETMGYMAPGVIHDLNNHLSVILAQLNMCMEEVDGTPRMQARIGKAERATLRCAQAVRGLLEFSRPGPAQPVECNLNDLVMTTVSLLEPVLGESIKVETDLAENLPVLQGEPVKLQQVLVNLALNARDAMRGCGALTFGTRLEGQGACLEVRDTGCGMTEEVRDKLFDPFYTTKDPGKGTGLGLTMVQRIVTAHGGTINVDSEEGSGTLFTIHLPVPA